MYLFFFSVLLNVNYALRKTKCTMVQKLFSQKCRFMTISLKCKGRLNDTFNFKKTNIFDTLNEKYESNAQIDQFIIL